MAHLTKLTRSEVGGIGVHVERQTDNHANKDINIEKSHLNYSLLEDDLNVHQRLAKRLNEVYVFNRKDVNVACSWIVTLPNTLLSNLESDKRLFFEETHNFLKNRYGGERNVIMSEVHRDETTEHLHFVFVPVVYDKNNDREKVSAKEVIDRNELKAFHSDLDTYLRETIPQIYLNGILNDKTIGLETVEDLKLYDKEISKKQADIKTLDIVLESKEQRLKDIADSMDLSLYPNYVKQNKNILTRQETVTLPKEEWEKHFVARNDYSNTQRYLKETNKALNTFQTTDFHKEMNSLIRENTILKQTVHQQEYRIEELEIENESYRRTYDILSQMQNSLRNVVKNNFDKLMDFTKNFKSVTPRLVNLSKGILSATASDKNIRDTVLIGKNCWNKGFDQIAEEIDLPANDLELKNYQSNKEQKSYELSR